MSCGFFKLCSGEEMKKSKSFPGGLLASNPNLVAKLLVNALTGEVGSGAIRDSHLSIPAELTRLVQNPR